MNEIIKYTNSDNMFEDICQIIDDAQRFAYRLVDNSLVIRNWCIGKRLSEETLKGENRAVYGAEIINNLSKDLSMKYGKGYSKRALYQYLRFYRMFPGIVYEVRTQSLNGMIVNEARTQFDSLLSWTHYRILTQVEDTTLQRNISTQYYYRLLKSQDKTGVENEMKRLTSQYQDKLEFIKNPVIAEFLGMKENTSYYESDLEQCIINNLQKFLIELGKGYAFVARQQHIHTEKEDYYIDLVFYNYILKCFVLIDLDEIKKSSDDNPTLGLVLCTETDEDIAKYSILHGNEQLFASKYKLYLPTEEELRAEIETQKEFYYLQKKD
jgi:predicted nuclease of restriction endonuclease-like (RecB) superfamily